MNPHGLAQSQAVEGIPASKLLEGLARLYQLVLVIDSQRRILWMSDELVNLCGGPDFQIGRDAKRIVPKLPNPGQVFAIRSQLRAEGISSWNRVEIETRGGKMLPVEVSVVPIAIDRDGEESRVFIAIARPIEEPRQPAGADARDLHAQILDRCSDAVIATDGRGYVTYANPAVEHLLGRPPEQLTDRPIALLSSSAADLEALVASLAPGGEVGHRDLTLRRADGRSVRVSVSASPLRPEASGRCGSVLLLRDETERGEAERDLRRKNLELEHCVHALSHDLRSPLVSLLGFSRLLRQDYGALLDDTGAHFLDRIEQAGRTMEDLIHSLLELSRIGEAGERRSHVDPRAVLLQLQAELKPRLDATGTRLILPQDPPMLYCDPTRLYQLFSNLVGNALDHMGPCKDPQVTIAVDEDADHHQIAVRDTGRGIEPENHQRIFEVFQSLRPSSDGRRGTGIGLAVVKKIVETHRGRVWVESRPGEGATFHIELPRR